MKYTHLKIFLRVTSILAGILSASGSVATPAKFLLHTMGKAATRSSNRPLAVEKFMAASSSILKPITVENDIGDYLKLSDTFEKNPELIPEVLSHMKFTVNGYEIHPNQKEVIYVLKDRPYEFSIATKQGNAPALSFLFKKPFAWLQLSFGKLLGFLPIEISYDCYDDKNSQTVADLVFGQEKLIELMDKPTYAKVWDFIKKHISWPDGLTLKLKLPPLPKEA